MIWLAGWLVGSSEKNKSRAAAHSCVGVRVRVCGYVGVYRRTDMQSSKPN